LKSLRSNCIYPFFRQDTDFSVAVCKPETAIWAKEKMLFISVFAAAFVSRLRNIPTINLEVNSKARRKAFSLKTEEKTFTNVPLCTKIEVAHVQASSFKSVNIRRNEFPIDF
jgi:hypothetical protein